VDDVRWMIAREIPRLRRYALAITGAAVAADDLVQDALERAIRKRHLWTRRGSVRNWLYRILYNVFLNQAAGRRRRQGEAPLDEMAHAPVEPARQEAHLACQDVAEAMGRLPPEQRAAIALTALEGLSYDEAAEVLRIPVGTLRSRLSRGRERLSAAWEPADTDTAPRLMRVK
jgi:RNA polymerase sigma-70 factor, ECF subfamily